MAEYSESVIVSDGAGGGKMNGALQLWSNSATTANKTLVSADSNNDRYLFKDALDNLKIANHLGSNSAIGIDTDGQGIQLMPAGIEQYNFQTGGLTKSTGINTVLLGVAPQRGSDIRAAVAAVDGAVVLNFTNPSASVQAFRITVDLEGEAGTITSAVYTYKFIRNTVTITKTVSISAVNTASTVVDMIQVDASSAITGQLTTLTGTTPKVDVTVLVEGITAGA